MLGKAAKILKRWIGDRPLLWITLGGILLVGFLCTAIFLPGPSRWKGYYLVLLDGKIDWEQTILQLKTAGFDDVLSIATAPVMIHSFSHLENLYVSTLRGRLQPEDSRFDGFLSKVESVFQTEPSGAHVLYFPIRYHPLYFFFRLASILPDRKWMLADWDFFKSIGLLSLFLLFTVFQTIRTRTHRWIRILLGVPWIPVILQGNLIGLILAVWCYQVFTTLVDSLLPEVEQYLYYGKNDGVGTVLSRFANHILLVSVILLLVSDRSVLVGIIFGSFLTIGLGIEFIMARVYYLRFREHRIFLPLPILPIHWKETKGTALYGGLVLLALAPLLYTIPTKEWQLQVPSPRENSIQGFFATRTAYRDLWALHKKDPLPNLSDFIVHLKYQSEFPFGATYDFPSPKDELSYPRFREEGGKLTLWNETIVKYDQTWYKRTLKRVKEDRLGNLFYRQGVRTTVWEPISKRPLGMQLFLYYMIVLLVASPFYRSKMSLMHKPTQWILGLITRRKQQEA